MNEAVVLCAGKGERLLPLTRYLPKPLFPVMGEPLLIRILNKLISMEMKRVFINTHHLPDKIEKLSLPEELKIKIRYEENILGTGGGIGQFRGEIKGENFLVVNGDVYLDNFSLNEVFKEHIKKKNLATLIMCDYPLINSVGIKPSSELDFRPDISEKYGVKKATYTGIGIFNKRILNYIPEKASLVNVLQQCIDKKERVRGFFIRDIIWQDIGTMKRYLSLHRSLIKRYNIFPVIIENNTEVHQEAKFEGFVVIGKNCKIGKVFIRDSVIWDRVRIETGRFENAVITPWEIVYDR